MQWKYDRGFAIMIDKERGIVQERRTEELWQTGTKRKGKNI